MLTGIINNIISEYETLNSDDKEYLLDVLRKQLIEDKRELIYKRYKESRKNLSKNKVKKGSFKELYSDLENA